MDKRKFNLELNAMKDRFPDRLPMIESIQRGFNRDIPSISRENLRELYQNPAQFMVKRPSENGEWTTMLHEWADNGVSALLEINPIYLAAKNSYGDTVLMNLVEYAVGKTTEQIDYGLLKSILEHPLVYEYKTGNEGDMEKETIWNEKDITGKTPVDYLKDMSTGEGTCSECDPITELIPLIAEWESLMASAMGENDERRITEEDDQETDSECECGEHPDEDVIVSSNGIIGDPGKEEGYPSSMLTVGTVDDYPDDISIPEEAGQMKQDEIEHDPLMRDTGMLDRIG